MMLKDQIRKMAQQQRQQQQQTSETNKRSCYERLKTNRLYNMKNLLNRVISKLIDQYLK